MRRPHFELQEVKRLAQEDRFALGMGPASGGALESYLHGELGSYRPFAQRVIQALTLEDFSHSRRWPEPEGELADEYGLRLPAAVQEAFEVEVATWYVKVSVRSNRKEQLLFFMSLHPLAYEMWERNGGVLRPER
ncbi:MAG TPA: hypothetical protein VLQ93_19550 [Myxococcaceae bacterium]|nr:hypothetical protein [Myxococcaceae bacterium]